MAIYHFSTQSISGGRSAVAAAAYRSGERLEDRNTGDVHDYRRRSGIIHEDSAVLLPSGAPSWAQDRQALWNAAQDAERNKDGTMRKNARVAREWEVSLPHELTSEQRRDLGHEFAREVVNRYGVAAQLDFHAPGKQGDNRNWHIHVQATSRELGRDGYGRKAQFDRADRDLKLEGLPTGKAQLSDLRKTWGEMANRALERAGYEERIDHRSLADQRDAARAIGDDEKSRKLDRLPTKHMGPAATSIERGKPLYRFGREVEGRLGREPRRTEIGDANRRIELASELGKLQREKEGARRSIIDTETTIGDALKQRNNPLERSATHLPGAVRLATATLPLIGSYERDLQKRGGEEHRGKEKVAEPSARKPGIIDHGGNSMSSEAKQLDRLAPYENSLKQAPNRTLEEPRNGIGSDGQSKSRLNLAEHFGHLLTDPTRRDEAIPGSQRDRAVSIRSNGMRNDSEAATLRERGPIDGTSGAQRAEQPDPPEERPAQQSERVGEETSVSSQKQVQQNRLQLLAVKIEQQREERDRQRREQERCGHTR